MKTLIFLVMIFKVALAFSSQPQDIDSYSIALKNLEKFEILKNFDFDNIPRSLDLSDFWLTITHSNNDETLPSVLIYLNLEDFLHIPFSNSSTQTTQCPELISVKFLNLSATEKQILYKPETPNTHNPEFSNFITKIQTKYNFQIRIITIVPNEPTEDLEFLDFDVLSLNNFNEIITFTLDHFVDLFSALIKGLDSNKYSFKDQPKMSYKDSKIAVNGVESSAYLQYVLNDNELFNKMKVTTYFVVIENIYLTLLQNLEITNEIIKPMIQSLFEYIQIKKVLDMNNE